MRSERGAHGTPGVRSEMGVIEGSDAGLELYDHIGT